MQNSRMSWAKFREQVNDSLGIEELRTLCFDLNIDYESLKGEGKKGKIRELIIYLRRNNQVAELVDKMQELRPHINWSEMLEKTDIDGAMTIVNINDRPTKLMSQRLATVSFLLAFAAIIAILMFSGRINLFDFGNNGANAINSQTTVSASSEINSSNSSDDMQSSCLKTYFEEIPAERRILMEVGENAKDVDIVQEDRESIEPTSLYGMQLTDGGQTIGAFQFSFHNRFEFLKVVSLVDSNCQTVELQLEGSFEDNDHFEFQLQGKIHSMGINFQGDHVRLNLKRFD